VQAWQAAQQGTEGGGVSQFFGISASLGSQKSSSKQTQEQSVSQGSSLTAGNNLNILATGSGAVGQDGDIRIQGSQLKAGNDMLLAANRDILLEAAANTQKLDGKNKSSGGAVGVSVGYSADKGVGLSIFANANQGSGKEIGTGTTWTETTLDAGSQVKLVSGRDTTLKGAQVNGEQIIANVGRDLTLQSLQDSDYYDAKQKNVSAGASVAIIGTGGSASVSASQSKIDSNYKSVQEQTGLYAGKGGFQIDVGNHTQLDGSVIASTAEADKNRLSTGTLGWSSIDNKADYKSQQQSVSISSGSDGSGKFISNMPSGMLVAYNHGDSASGTTGSAISNGTLEIRDPANQQQDVASLSRDIEHANGSISPIFDKEKEQNRLKQVQLIAEIGTQAMDIVRTQGEINANKAAQDELHKKGVEPPGPNASDAEQESYQKQLLATDAYKDIMSKYGTGGSYQKAAQAVTAVLQGLSGGDIGSALAGASAPYLASAIHEYAGNDESARLMAHAVLGALVASAQGNSSAAGAVGGAVAAAGTTSIMQALYHTTNSEELNESQKQTVSALASLASGMAGGLAGGDLSGAVTGAQAGKNAAENNEMWFPVDPGYGAAVTSLQEQMRKDGASADEIAKAAQGMARQDGFEGPDPVKGALIGTGVAIGVGAVALTPELLTYCVVNPVVCNEMAITAMDVAAGDAAMGGTVWGVLGGAGAIGIKEWQAASSSVKEGGKLVYLSNSTAPEVRERLTAAVNDIRQDLSVGGNVAFAEINIAELAPETMVLKAFSQYDERVGEFLPKPGGDLDSWVLKPQEATSKYIGTPAAYLRDMDTEFKILETVAQRLESNPLASGTINLISEKMVCPSCTDVVRQFRERYPNIKLNIFTVEK